MATSTRIRSWWCRTPRPRNSGRSRARPPSPWCASASTFGAVYPFGGRLAAPQESDRPDQGFAELVRAYPQLKHRLVLAGKETWFAGGCTRRRAIRRRRPHPVLRLRVRPRPAAAVQRVRSFRFPVVLRGIRAARARGHGLRPRGSLLQCPALPEVVDGAAILFDPFARRDGPRHRGPSAGRASCAPAWSAWACNGRRTSVGRRPPNGRWMSFTKSLEKARAPGGSTRPRAHRR